MLDYNFNVKLCDFGMSRVQSLSAPMSRLGTLQWVAPEVLRGEAYTEKADVYRYSLKPLPYTTHTGSHCIANLCPFSFGVIAWELVTLKTPYEGIHQLKMANGIARGSLRLEFPETAPSQIINLSNM